MTLRSCSNDLLPASERQRSATGQESVGAMSDHAACPAKDGLSGVTAMTRFVNGSADAGDRIGSRDLAASGELSLEEVLKSLLTVNEEQAFAVCYQCCSGLRESGPPAGRVNRSPSAILLHRDGTVSLQPVQQQYDGNDNAPLVPSTEQLLVRSVGVAIYRVLDWGLDDSVERKLSPQLEYLIERMACADQGEEGDCTAGSDVTDEGYSGQEEEEEEEVQQGVLQIVCTFRQVMELCASQLDNPSLAPEHYQTVCRSLFENTLEMRNRLIMFRETVEMLRKITAEDTSEVDAVKHRAYLRKQLMKEIRQGVRLRNVQLQPFHPMPIKITLTPFQNLMQEIRDHKSKLRSVKASERVLRPLPPMKQCLHDSLMSEIKQGRTLKPVVQPSSTPFVSHPEPAETCPCNSKSTCPRIRLKAPTLAEIDAMTIFKEEESIDYRNLESSAVYRAGLSPTSVDKTNEGSKATSGSRARDERQSMEDFRHPVESLTLTLDEVINVRRVLVQADMEKLLPSKKLYDNLKKSRICCCCRVKFCVFSKPSTCLLCERAVCSSCCAKMKSPSKKMAHVPVYTVGLQNTPKRHGHTSQAYTSFCSVEKEFPHLYTHGCTLYDICTECITFIANVISSCRRSMDMIKSAPKRDARAAASAAAAAAADHSFNISTTSGLYLNKIVSVILHLSLPDE